MSYKDEYDHRCCERCGHEIDNGHEHSFGEFDILCAGCERKLRHAPAPKVVPARFIGVQPGFADLPPVALFNIGHAIQGNGYSHSAGSTLTRFSVNQAGWMLPEEEIIKAQNALLNHMAQIRCIFPKEVAA
jgi:hypothetical protein